jgi:hypothetical protein
LEDDVAATSAVAAAGAALGAKSFAQEGDTSLPTVPGAGVNFYLINKQKKSIRSHRRAGGRLHGFGCGLDIDAAAVFIEENPAVYQGEKSPIAPGADIFACDEFGTALTDEDAAGGDKLAAELLDAKPLADAVAAVAYAALAFFMCHNLTP